MRDRCKTCKWRNNAHGCFVRFRDLGYPDCWEGVDKK